MNVIELTDATWVLTDLEHQLQRRCERWLLWAPIDFREELERLVGHLQAGDPTLEIDEALHALLDVEPPMVPAPPSMSEFGRLHLAARDALERVREALTDRIDSAGGPQMHPLEDHTRRRPPTNARQSYTTRNGAG